MAGSTDDAVAHEPSTRDVEAVLDATRAVGALIAETLATADPSVTMPQWRVLVLASEGDCNVSAVAEDLEIHASNATRICDRLVQAGLLRRERAAWDRRHVLLVLTDRGRHLVDTATADRRRRIARAMSHLSPQQQEDLAQALRDLAGALHDSRSR